MKIVGAWWTSVVNQLKIDCDCGEAFYHRADRWRVKCPICGRLADLGDLREAYVHANEVAAQTGTAADRG